MGMYDNIGDVDGGSGSNNRLPVGQHPAMISDVKEDTEKERVQFTLNFLGTNSAPRNTWFFGGDDKEKVAKFNALKVKQLRNIGFTINDATKGRDVQRAIKSMDGKYVLVDVKNRPGSDYQSYWLAGEHFPARPNAQNDSTPAASTDELPF